MKTHLHDDMHGNNHATRVSGLNCSALEQYVPSGFTIYTGYIPHKCDMTIT